ncbi:MAG: hypothetical protein COA57_11690 [Flavobacteriales bacterium]|nr:MAG: hypothetical protein COA57_11690 [Flavobacteriales bacterium]
MKNEQGQTHCTNCNTELKSAFCHECGEKVMDEKDRSFKALVGQFIDALTSADGKLLKSIRYLITKPGFLTEQFIQGKRKSYTKPINLFLLINLLYFILVPHPSFDLPLKTQLHGQPHKKIAQKLLDNKLASKNLTLENYEPVYNSHSRNVSKTLMILNVPLFALFLLLFHWKRKLYYSEHFIFSLHFYSIIMLFLIVVMVAFYALKPFTAATDISDDLIVPLFTCLSTLYLTFAFKRVFKSKSYISFFKALLLTFCLLPVITAYRFLLFVVVLYTS